MHNSTRVYFIAKLLFWSNIIRFEWVGYSARTIQKSELSLFSGNEHLNPAGQQCRTEQAARRPEQHQHRPEQHQRRPEQAACGPEQAAGDCCECSNDL